MTGTKSGWSSREKWRAVLIPALLGIAAAAILFVALTLTATPASTRATWNLVLVSTSAGGIASLIIGARMCSRFIKAQRIRSATA